ncbi:MAG: AmmeMemoRadiSam system protein B [Candidatus Omnitrophota bacterium]
MAINIFIRFLIRRVLKSFFVLCIFCVLIPANSFANSQIKKPNVAGVFYPGDAKDLRAMINSYLDQTQETSLKGEPVVLISPHAGYVYSGPVAAYGFAALKGRHFDTVVILAPCHYFYFKGASIYPGGFFQTPLGNIAVDEGLSETLLKLNNGLFIDELKYFEREHSLEVQLPFLQIVLSPDFKIVPILVGDVDLEDCKTIADALAASTAGKQVLILASTDLSHYRSYDEALYYDHKTVDFIKNFDIVGLWDAVSSVSWNVCGIRPLAISLFYAQYQNAKNIEVVHYANSGDIMGDRSRVVGYLSALLCKEQKQTGKNKMSVEKGAVDMLTKEDKKELLAIARSAIETYLSTGNTKVPAQHIESPGLNLKRGLFVTLHKKGRLRGCLGIFSSDEPLYQSVAKIAIDSSTRDYRFSPVEKGELKDINIEISVLSEPKLIDDWRKIRLGTDGVIVKKDSFSGVFLPQVASETGWDLETFLGQLCSQKAGLPYNAFKDPATKIYVFQADVFAESEK